MWDLLLNPCTGIGGLVYALAMQCSSILYVLFEMKVVKCKLCESTSRFGGMKMLPRAVCSSTHFALVVIRIWTSWTLMMTLIYFRMKQSPGSCFFGDVQCYFDELRCGKASNRSADIVGKVEKVFILFGIDRPSSPTGRHPVSHQPCQVG